jgi:hypothetical protein
MLGQKRFYASKFTTVNLKKGVNQKTGVKVQCFQFWTVPRTNLIEQVSWNKSS